MSRFAIEIEGLAKTYDGQKGSAPKAARHSIRRAKTVRLITRIFPPRAPK